MNTLQSSLRAGWVWLAPVAALVVAFLWQTDWGRAFAGAPQAETAPATPQPLTIALLPEYQPPAAPASGGDIVERTLFNPTRRPAPAPMQEGAKPKIQRGQFTLAGTLMVDGRATAYLREQNGGKQRRVTKGESVNGMLVAEITPDRVRLTLGEESEELVMKLATGPRTTIQPVVTPLPGTPVTAGAAPPGGGSAAPVPQARDVAEILAERRRAARAAEVAAQGLPPGAPNPEIQRGPVGPVTAPTMPPVPQGDMGTNDPRWQQLYQRYQQQRR